jgi:hypothetical protein
MKNNNVSRWSPPELVPDPEYRHGDRLGVYELQRADGIGLTVMGIPIDGSLRVQALVTYEPCDAPDAGGRWEVDIIAVNLILMGPRTTPAEWRALRQLTVNLTDLLTKAQEDAICAAVVAIEESRRR